MPETEIQTQEVEIQAGEGVVPLSLDEIKACSLGEMARDKFKSRQLQRSLSRGGQDHQEMIIAKALENDEFKKLVSDQHGNYLCQKIMEVVNNEQFDVVFNMLKDDLIPMAKDTHGTRGVQKIVEQAISRDRVEQLVQALPPEKVEELARHITGFHVIVKLLDSLPADRASELLERLCGEPQKVIALGKDQWGCCVLKKCADRSEGALKEKILDSIGEQALDLVQDPFGNYVVQHLIINRSPGQNAGNVTRVIDGLRGHVFELSLQKYSSNVLEKCLGNSSDKDRNKIINEILNPPNNMRPSEAVCKLLFHQFGNYVFQQALEVSKDPQFSLLIEHCKQHIQELYIQASQQQQQGGKGSADSGPTAQGNLPAEHSQRLAVKLVKKYPALTEGMDMGNVMIGMDAAWMFDVDPMGYGLGYYGMDPYGYPLAAMGFDPMTGGYGLVNNTTFVAPQKGQGAKGRGNQGRRGKSEKQGKGKQGGQRAGEGAGKGGTTIDAATGETVRVGRIVGFWPNYTITYDEVAAPGQSGGGNRNRNQKKAKSKAAPKPKAVADA